MPAIKSSSKTGTKLVVFASERNAIQNARKAADWIAEHATNQELSKAAGEASDAIARLLSLLPKDAAANGKPPAEAK